MNNYYEYIGYVGAFFISINLIPQIVHIYIIKNADSISVTSIILGIISSVFMLTYGLFIYKIPIIISNSTIFISYCIILFFKYLYSF
jgi:uncharacterized protein with PQ loop repeat